MLSLLTVTIFVFGSTFSTLPLNACSFLPAGGVWAAMPTDSDSTHSVAVANASIRRNIGFTPLLLASPHLDQQRVRPMLGHVDHDAVADFNVRDMGGLAGVFEFGLRADRKRFCAFVGELHGH